MPGPLWRGWLLAGVAVLAGCVGAPPAVAPPAPEAAPWTLTLLHINDHHSNLDARRRTLRLDDGAGSVADVEVDAAGFARVAQAMHELAARTPHVLKLHAGDATTGTLYFSRAGQPGEADAALMNTVCFDAMALGNHEFDKGDTSLRGFVQHLRAGACPAPTAVLAANVRFGEHSALHPSRAPGWVRPSVVVEQGGRRIGLLGITVAGKTQASSSPDAGTTFEDEAHAAQREIDALRAQGASTIVLISHVGYAVDVRLARQLRGVDVIVGGDSHTLLGPAALHHLGVGDPAGEYPTRVQGADGSPVCIVQAWEYAQVVGELQVALNAQGRVRDCTGTPHVLVGDALREQGQPVQAERQGALRARLAASGVLRPTQPSAQALQALAPYAARVVQFSRTPVAVAPDELCARRVPGGAGSADHARSSVACNAAGSVDAHGGDMQQLVAEAYLQTARRLYGGADIALQNAGGVRVPLQGTVTASTVHLMLPFGNTLHRLDLSGHEVRAMVEDGLDAVFGPAASTGAYPYTAGLRFDVNAAAPKGQRARALQVRDAASGAWRALDDHASYRVFALAFNARGGDGYPSLAAVPPERRMDIGVVDADAFMAYLETLPADPVSGLPLLRRLPLPLYSTQHFQAP